MSRAILSVLFLSFTLIGTAQEPNLDPQYKDDTLNRLSYVFVLNGALQPDETAISGGANEWKIDVKVISLKGKTNEALDKSWESLVAKEHRFLIDVLAERYGDEFPARAKLLIDSSVVKFAKETDFDISVERGLNRPEIVQWLLKEVLTRAGLARAEWSLVTELQKKTLEFIRLHDHDSNSEILGEDTLLIRGTRKAIVVRISYAHA